MSLPLALTLAATIVVAAACSGDDETSPTASTAPTASTVASQPPSSTAPPSTAPATTAALAAAGWTTQSGWEQVAVLDAEPGTTLELVDDVTGAVVSDGPVDELGSLLFRDVAAGVYRVRSAAETTARLKVAAFEDLPPPAFYAEQRLPAGGFGYLETRDGTTLSVNVVLPGPADGGPYPTVVEYSGYEPSNPNAAAFAQVYTTLGYAYVGVNMRGSGCSGGSFEFFEDAQLLDGYDTIETVAAQPWVLDNRVGMVGVSYPGISQLFVAATNPPSLAAITPLSVIDDSSLGVTYPGGILNTGFAVEWAQQRVDETTPQGQSWTRARVASGDDTCAANQRLRLQNPDLVQQIGDNPFWTDDLAAPLAPRLFVDRIDVPVFLAGAWQDEQTGGRFATMLDQFTGTEHLYAGLVNGLHTESIASTGIFARYVEFLDLYVARRVPSLVAAGAIAPVLSSTITGTDQVTLPADRFAGQTYEEALATFESEPPIQVLFEEGAADGAVPGSPQPRWTQSFDAWPIPATATAWYLGDGTLTTEPSSSSVTAYAADPSAVPAAFFDGDGSVWAYDVTWDWPEPPDGTVASFVGEPFAADTVIVGSGSADLWIRSDADDTDIEVTISEIRPDGQEVYVQSGWLRASQRALDDEASTELRPVHTHTEADAEPLAGGDEWNPVRVELFPVAHAFRAGSRLRVTVDAPGGNRAEWIFETIADGETVEIAHDLERPSRIVLPVVDGVEVPAPYPTCTLRGQPCRPAPS